MRSNVHRILASCVFLTFLWAPIRTIAQEGPSSEPSQEQAAAKALIDLEQASQSLTAWRQAVEEDATISKSEAKQFEEYGRQMFEMFRQVGRIRELRRQQIQAKRKAEGKAEDRILSYNAQAEAWVNKMRSIGDGAAEERANVVAELREALQSDDGGRQFAALKTLHQVGDVNYDKASFRPLVLPLVKSAKSHTLVSAAYALFNTERMPEDLQLIQQAWQRRSPAVEESMSHLLFLFSDGKIRGRSEEIIRELLASPHAEVRRKTLQGLWGADVSDKLADRLIELADDPASRHAAIYFGLSTLKPKNEAVVDKLIETLADPDWINNGGRALWGLGFGVPEELQPKVVEALTDLYVARSDPRTREKARRIIREYGGEAAVERLPE